MKKLVCVLATLMLMSVAALSLAEGDLLSAIQEKGTLVIATEGNWSPWTYHDENDQLTGFDIEIAKMIAEGLGVTPEFRETEWSSILAGVDTGVFDIACNGVGYTEDRAAKYAFTDPYVYTESVLVVRSDNEEIRSLEDLQGKRTSNSPNSTYALLAEKYGAEVDYLDALDATISQVLTGRADATINAKGSIDDYLSQHPEAELKIVATFPGDAVVYPVKKGEQSDTLVAAINEILAKAREDGTLAELSVKYFGKDLTQPQ